MKQMMAGLLAAALFFPCFSYAESERNLCKEYKADSIALLRTIDNDQCSQSIFSVPETVNSMLAQIASGEIRDVPCQFSVQDGPYSSDTAIKISDINNRVVRTYGISYDLAKDKKIQALWKLEGNPKFHIEGKYVYLPSLGIGDTFDAVDMRKYVALTNGYYYVEYDRYYFDNTMGDFDDVAQSLPEEVFYIDYSQASTRTQSTFCFSRTGYAILKKTSDKSVPFKIAELKEGKLTLDEAKKKAKLAMKLQK